MTCAQRYGSGIARRRRVRERKNEKGQLKTNKQIGGERENEKERQKVKKGRAELCGVKE